MTQTLAIMVTTPPTENCTNSALQIAKAATDSKQLLGIFFYQAGVLNASKHLAIPSDEQQVIKQWQQLHQQHGVPLHLCATAADKFGLIDEQDDSALIAPEFTLSGLGELVSLANQADKLIQL